MSVSLLNRTSLTRLGVVVATGAATLAASASPSQAAVKVTDEPFLGRISGGAAVLYTLSDQPAHQVVEIGGRPAKVKLFDRGDNEYAATIFQAGLEHGRSYRVTIKVKRAGGTSLLVNERLYLHRSTNRTK